MKTTTPPLLKAPNGWTFFRQITLPGSSKPLYLTVNVPNDWFERQEGKEARC